MGVTTAWFLSAPLGEKFELDFDHRLVPVAMVLFIGAAAVDLIVHRPVARRRPLSRRMVQRVERLAEQKRLEVLGKDLETLIIVRTLLPHLAGRMWRTQLVLRCNDPDHSPVIVTIPALATEDGKERRFALVRRKVPSWLLEAEPGYRFHARVDLGSLEDRRGWGYVMDFERDRVSAEGRGARD
jgi:hypothetical protein